jgi:DNA repair protein RecN (Recombination protein N)
LQELQRVDAGAANLVELHAGGVGAARIAVRNFRATRKKVDVDPARLAELEERLNLLHSLKRKYGATLAEVIAFGDEAKQKFARSKAAMPNWRGSMPRWKNWMRNC